MLVARATSRAMRRYFPDMFGGVYCAEERVDIRADRAAGQHEDITERILAAVDEPTSLRRPLPLPPKTRRSRPVVDRGADAAALLLKKKSKRQTRKAIGRVSRRGRRVSWAQVPRRDARGLAEQPCFAASQEGGES